MTRTIRAAASHLDTIRCGLYFIGQNLFYLLIFIYLNTYFTDIGIPVLAVAAIAPVIRLLDACSGPLFIGVFSRLKHKNRIAPWLRLSVLLLPLSAVALFSIPAQLPVSHKILWAGCFCLIWDVGYTLSNAPLFGLEESVTMVRHGRTVLSSVGRLCAMIAMCVLLVVIPSFRTRLGGWSGAVALLSVLGAVSMVPGCFRRSPGKAAPAAGRSVTLREIFRYLRGNRYLALFYLAFLLIGTLNVTSCWGLYIARFCLGTETVFTVTGILALIPGVLLGAAVPSLTRRADKIHLFRCAVIAAIVMQGVRFLVGYHSIAAYVGASVLASIPTGFASAVLLRFARDCAEYGRYTGQVTDPALPFATQMFFVKLQSAGVMVLSCVVLAGMGFVEGAGAVQSPEFVEKLWSASILIPIAGMVAGLLVMRQYDLRDHDVALMQMCNEGRLSPEEARRQLRHIRLA